MTELIAFLTITVLAVISPGADFAMVSRNSLLYSRRAGLLTALGIGAGVTVHVGYSILGVGMLVRESLALFTALKLAGAAYLVFLGLRMLLAREVAVADEVASGAGVSSWAMLRGGFLTNALNPKTCLFVVSLFMQVIDPHSVLPAQLGYGAFIVAAHLAWFGLVACFLSSPPVRARLVRFRRRIDQFFGALLVGFGVLLGTKSS
ncbi:LysE family transporter [Pseudomonas paraeruginosa]|uniref:LysE family transporter n=1 Tax=Pseudomonas paraeruginosa TaxID=2994495 RepID=UPI00374934C6